MDLMQDQLSPNPRKIYTSHLSSKFYNRMPIHR